MYIQSRKNVKDRLYETGCILILFNDDFKSSNKDKVRDGTQKVFFRGSDHKKSNKVVHCLKKIVSYIFFFEKILKLWVKGFIPNAKKKKHCYMNFIGFSTYKVYML